jgi:hypothetical protein
MKVRAKIVPAITVPISPSDINAEAVEVRFGGKHEVGKTAANLIRFFQRRGSWRSFTMKELIHFYATYAKEMNPDMAFFGLMGPWADNGGVGEIHESPPYIVQLWDGHYFVTELFVMECAKCGHKKVA